MDYKGWTDNGQFVTSFREQLVAWQLKNLYDLLLQPIELSKKWYESTFMLYVDLRWTWEYLEQGKEFDLSAPEEVKKKMWVFAKEQYKYSNQPGIKYYNKVKDEGIKALMKKEQSYMYKSYILRWILCELFYNENKRMDINNDSGEVVQTLSFTGR